MAGKQARTSSDRTQDRGSARAGVGHWWMQRLTAVALIPLTLWLTASLIARARDDYGSFIAWLRLPFTTVMMVSLLIALFYHVALGLQVVVEDYVHADRIQKPAVVVIYLASFALAAAGIVTTLRIAYS
jgi:succinate dehydrogenase / fumarate reductase membrane anchor subunit